MVVICLLGCGELAGASRSQPAPAAEVAQGQPVYTPGPEMGRAALAPLPDASPEGLSAAPAGWWFGTERDGQNRPLQCVEMQDAYESLGLVCLGPEENAVYLTFDLGYEGGYTGDILDTLDRKAAPATFFVVYGYAEEHASLVERMLAEGHSVGSHSVSHPAGPDGMAALDPERRRYELSALEDVLYERYGYESGLFRFPEGIYSERLLGEAAGLGLHSIFWSYAYRDWETGSQPPQEESLRLALDAAHPGAVYLLHPFETNAAILGDLIDGLRAAGYEIKAL